MLTYHTLHECRDSACRRPFGVRLRGNDWFHRSLLHRCAAPLRMTRRVWRIVEYNLFVAMLLYLTDSHCTTHATISPLCHSERSGKDIGIQAIKLRFAAESNPEGAPAGEISALVYGIVQPSTSNIPPKRNDPRVVPPRSATNFLPFLSGSGSKAQAVPIPLDGIGCGSSRNSQHGIWLHKNQHY